MDLTPPSLTRSPTSPPNTYCPSDRSSLEYPSPVLSEQHYRIASIYASDQSCSMAHPLGSEHGSLPRLDSAVATEWNSSAVMAPTSSATSVPNVLSPEYDPFANYESAVPQQYGHDAYSHSASHGPPTMNSPHSSADASRSPAAPLSRSSLSFASYPQTSAPNGSLAPRVKMENPAEYNPVVDVSHYPSPRSVHGTYGPEANSYAHSTPSYLEDGQPSPWSKHDFETESQYYSGSAGQSPHLLNDSRRQFRIAKHRRPTRRMTSREEANFQCEVKGCGKLFSRSYNFKAHMETHDEKREYPFPCPIKDCSKKFVRKTDLQRHHQSVHMKERNHKCDYCGRLFARKDTLRRHMEDGCSKRFDIGTLDLRAEGYDASGTSNRPMLGGSSMNQMVPQAGILPPMTMGPNTNSSLLGPVLPAVRGRGMLGSTSGSGDQGQVPVWHR